MNTVVRRLHDPDVKSENDTEMKTHTQRKPSASDHSTEVTQDILKYLTIIPQRRTDREYLMV